MITDLDYLKTMAGDDPVFIREMIDIFKEQVEEYKVIMVELLEKSDFQNLSKAAHKAKSSVAVMGMTKEADLLKKLELLAKENKESGTYGQLVEDFLSSAEAAVVELDELYS